LNTLVNFRSASPGFAGQFSVGVNNLAIFYRDFGYSAGPVRLGRIDGDVSALAVRGTVKMRIEAVE